MSFSNAPDFGLLGRVAGALAVDEAFVEKDWFVVQAIAALPCCVTDEIAPIFSGGTSLLKGHRLISRFSEDMDFKLGLSERFLELSRNQQSNRLSAFRKHLVSAWEARGFQILDVQAHDASRFIRVELAYPTIVEPHAALRPHILAELSAKPPLLPPVVRSVSSFVAQAQGKDPEIEELPCVDPLETAMDKLSALSWRLVARDRSDPNDDPTVVRHLHDLAALESVVTGAAAFSSLVGGILDADGRRGGGAVAGMAPAERLRALLELLERDELYGPEYERYVAGMVFAGPPTLFSYDDALAALGRICAGANVQ